MDRNKKSNSKSRHSAEPWEMTDSNNLLNRHLPKSNADSDAVQPPAMFVEKLPLWLQGFWRLFQKH
jgi:hypothetical protein